MKKQFTIYKSYFPTAKQIAPVIAFMLLAVAMFSVNGQITAQEATGSVTDQAMQSIQKQADNPASSTDNKETEEKQNTEQPPQSTTDKATEGAASAEANGNKRDDAEPKVESPKPETTEKPTKKPAEQPQTAPVTNAEQIPTTGPVENTIAVVAIVATGYMLRDYLRSRAEFTRSIFS